MDKKIKIVYAEDKELYRNMILEELQDYDISCIGVAANGVELLELLKCKKPDVVLLDLEMPIMDGNQAMTRIMADYPETKVLVISLHYETELVDDYINRGAMGYISKDVICGKIETLVEAIQKIKDGEIFVYPLTYGLQRTFTSRQVEIIPLICDELTNKEIAAQLGIQERGVERQRQKIYSRTNSTGATSFLKFAFKKGLDLLERRGKGKK